MAAGIAHDANNLLTALRCELEAMTPASPPDPEALEIALTSVRGIEDLNRRLANAGRQRTSVDVRELDVLRSVRELVDSLKSHHEVRGCVLHVVGGEGEMTLRTSPTLLAQAVGNLVVNAAEATHGRGRVEVRLSADRDTVCIEVHDDGPGVPEARRANLFTALETTKPSGTGLGLYSTRVCVQAVGGDVEVGDSPLGGARFRIRLDRVTGIGVSSF
jgi:signal transduction histidine kinase